MAKIQNYVWSEGQSIVVQATDWFDLDSLELGIPASKLEENFTPAKFFIDLSVSIPGDGTSKAEIGAQKVVRDYRQKYRNAYQKALPLVLQHLEDGNDQEASKLLEEANKFILASFKKFRVELRKGIAQAIGRMRAEELQTVGDTKFKGIRLASAREFNLDDHLPDILKLDDSLKRRGWQHCAVVWKGTDARVAIDKKREINDSSQKRLKAAFDQSGSKVGLGMIFCCSQTNLVFQFLDTNRGLPSNKKTLKSILRDGLEEQTNSKLSHVKVLFGAEYSLALPKDVEKAWKEKDAAKSRETSSTKEKPRKGRPEEKAGKGDSGEKAGKDKSGEKKAGKSET